MVQNKSAQKNILVYSFYILFFGYGNQNQLRLTISICQKMKHSNSFKSKIVLKLLVSPLNIINQAINNRSIYLYVF